MAKICINPKCEKEIPSSATFCSFCGTQQVENENLSEEEKLRIELIEANKTIVLLKKSLADAQAKVENDTPNEEIGLLKEQLSIAEDEQKNIEIQIAEKNKEIERLILKGNKKKKNGAWIFFLLVSIALGITAIYFYNESESWERNYYLVSREQSDNQDEIQTLRNEIDNLKRQNTNQQNENTILQNENANLQNEISDLKTKTPKEYRTTSNTYIYKQPQGETTDMYYYSDRTITIYTIRDGYGLTDFGWVLMYHLRNLE